MKSSGILLSDPQSESGTKLGEWWLILTCCPDLARYYRMIYNTWNRTKDLKLMKPAWDAHVSVVRGEIPEYKDLWRSWDGKEMEFSYDPELSGNGEYYWLDVECEELLDIREKLGLPRMPVFGLHLTIGRRTSI